MRPRKASETTFSPIRSDMGARRTVRSSSFSSILGASGELDHEFGIRGDFLLGGRFGEKQQAPAPSQPVARPSVVINSSLLPNRNFVRSNSSANLLSADFSQRQRQQQQQQQEEEQRQRRMAAVAAAAADEEDERNVISKNNSLATNNNPYPTLVRRQSFNNNENFFSNNNKSEDGGVLSSARPPSSRITSRNSSHSPPSPVFNNDQNVEQSNYNNNENDRKLPSRSSFFSASMGNLKPSPSPTSMGNNGSSPSPTTTAGESGFKLPPLRRGLSIPAMIEPPAPSKGVTVEELMRRPEGFAAAASKTLIGMLDSLPQQLKILQKLVETTQKFDECEPLNESKVKAALDHLYELDRLIREQDILFSARKGAAANAAAIISRNPKPATMREASILFKSLLFTLPHQLDRLQEMMSEGYIANYDIHTISMLLDRGNSEKFESMRRHASDVMSMMAIMVKVPLAVAKFRAGGRRYHQQKEVVLSHRFT